MVLSLSRPVRQLVIGRGAADIVAALECAVDEGWCAAVRVFVTGGGGKALVGLRGTRSDEGPMALEDPSHPAWRALRSGEPVECTEEGCSPCLAWPLRDEGAEFAVVLVDLDDPSAPAPELVDLVTLAGPALGRALERDAFKMRSQALNLASSLVEDGLIMARMDGELLLYSDGLRELVGWTAADVREHGWINLVYATEDERAAANQAIAAMMKGAPSEGTIRRLQRKDGTSMTATFWSRMIPDSGAGSPVLLGVIRDVTGRDAERRASARDESLRHLGSLIRGVAHDFNNLLCAIMGHAELISTTSTDEATRRRAETQLQAAERGADLARQLMAFGGSSSARAAPFDAGQMLASWTARFKDGLPAELHLRTIVEQHLPQVMGDSGQLHQAVLNILLNARQAAGDAGWIVATAKRLELPEGVVWCSTGAPSVGTSMVRIEVSDSGPGFTPEAMERLFEPLRSTRERGHGVGLAAVRQIVERYGGAIDVANTPGGRVSLYLPICTEPELPSPEPTSELSSTPIRVWILDGHEEVREFSGASLGEHGIDTRLFADEASLVDVGRTAPAEERPDALVLDLSLANGVEEPVLAQLRNAGVDAPVLWVSASVPEDVSPHEPFLGKPYTGRDLLRSLRALLTPG